MRRRIGELWMALGALHLLVIAASGHDELTGILRDGYVNAIGTDADRNAFFWALFLGMPTILVGVALRSIQRATGAVPQSVSWFALVGFALGASAMPASGFWLGIALAVYGIVVARSDARTRSGRGPRPGPGRRSGSGSGSEQPVARS